MSCRFGLALLVVAVMRGGTVQTSLAFTTVPLRVIPREKARNARSDVIMARVASERGSVLPEDLSFLKVNHTATSDLRLIAIQGEYHARLAHQEALHARAMAEQRVKLLEGMIPLAAHNSIVESYERQASDYIAESTAASTAHLSAIAGDFMERQEEMRKQIEERDESLAEAETTLRDMSSSLMVLKRDVGSLRAALRTHAARADEAQKALALEIRQTEVEPQKRRADAAENELVELRRSTREWMSAAYASKTEAAAEARAEGYLEGRAEAEADAAVQIASLRAQVDKAYDEALAHRARSREERLALREAVAEAREEGFAMVTKLERTATTAIEASRQAWKAQGYAEGLEQGRVAAEAELRPRLQEAQASIEAAKAGEAEIRRVFAAYIVRAHEEKLDFVAKERFAAKTRTDVLMKKLAEITSALARMLQERIGELEAKRDAVFSGETWALSSVSIAEAKNSSIIAEIEPLELTSDTSQPFWQECGGGQQK